MAKYFLGKKDGLSYVAFNLENVGTSIMDVVNFTSSFIDEIEFKNYLLSNNLIDNYNEEVLYLKEEGQKNNRSYTTIHNGNNMVYGINKEYMRIDFLSKYISQRRYDKKFVELLLFHYLIKYNVHSLIRNKILKLTSFRQPLENFFNKLAEMNNKYASSKNRILYLYDNDPENLKEEMEIIVDRVMSSPNDVVALYYYFKNYLDIPYAITLNFINKLKMFIFRAEKIGIEQIEKSIDEQRTIDTTLDLLFTSIFYKYDPETRRYKKENNEFVVHERNVVDLGLFIMLYDKEQKRKEDFESYQYSEDQEEFLEEEDFERINSTSEKEGVKLVLRDNQKS